MLKALKRLLTRSKGNATHSIRIYTSKVTCVCFKATASSAAMLLTLRTHFDESIELVIFRMG